MFDLQELTNSFWIIVGKLIRDQISHTGIMITLTDHNRFYGSDRFSLVYNIWSWRSEIYSRVFWEKILDDVHFMRWRLHLSFWRVLYIFE